MSRSRRRPRSSLTAAKIEGSDVDRAQRQQRFRRSVSVAPGVTPFTACATHNNGVAAVTNGKGVRKRCSAPLATTIMTQSSRRPQARAVRLDFCPRDKVMQIENDYDKEVYNGTSLSAK